MTDPQIFQRLHPHAYLERFLAEGVRPDGRAPRAWRDVFVNVGVCATAIVPPFAYHRRVHIHGRRLRPRTHGQDHRRVWHQGRDRRARARHARSRLHRYAAPSESIYPASRPENTLVPNIDLPALCSPKFKPGPPSEDAQVLSERLNDALVRSVSLYRAANQRPSAVSGPTSSRSTRSA